MPIPKNSFGKSPNSKSLILITMFHNVNIVSHFKQTPFVTPPVGHSERSEESPPFMFRVELEEGTHPSSINCRPERSEGSSNIGKGEKTPSQLTPKGLF
jgi:hypothetical protein